jgi:hypothetical protein
MKAEIELTPHGEVVEMTFTYYFCKAEPDVGYMYDYFEFDVESYVPFDEDGFQLPEVDGDDLTLTGHIFDQLSDAATADMENVPERVTRACDIKDSMLAPLFESLGQGFGKLTIRRS